MEDMLQQAPVTPNPPVDSVGLESDSATPENPDLPISEDLQGCLTDILRKCELEDQGVYWAMIQKWARLEYYFNNIIALFWDSGLGGGLGGWRIPDWDSLESDDELNIPPRIIAVYRAHAEAIIAALSTTVPSVVFFPDDAENPLDIEAADTHSQISSLIQKHVKAPMIFMRALTVFFNHGTIFAYNYYKTDPKYGMIHKPKYAKVQIPEFSNTCPVCDNEYGRTDGPILEPLPCPVCGEIMPPNSQPMMTEMTVQDGVDSTPKGRVLIDVFDPRSVKVSIYAKEQINCGYLLLNFSQNVGYIRSVFKDNKIGTYTNQDSMDWARNSTNYFGAAPENVASVKCLWLRPWQFHILGDGKEKEINELLALYPDGCYVIFINDEIKYATQEALDDHWTISINPLSSFIHGEPLGTNLATAQDIQAEIDELRLQTVEHGIPETFVKPEVLDIDQYNKSMARPGSITQTKGADPTKPLGEGFFQTKTATLSQEIETFDSSINQRAQFVTGSFPSIYGGSLEGGGGTAYEYKKSNANALQRLGITWKVIAEFWCDLITKSTAEFVVMMEEDEKFTEKQGAGFKNIEIKKASLIGKVNRAEPEFSDQLPVTWEQINQVLTNLMQMGSQEINEVLFNPNNAQLMKKGIGLRDLYIPGEEDRTKQYAEFIELSQGQPMPMAPPEILAQIPPGVDPAQLGIQMQSSVMPEPIDNHEVHMAVLADILNSPRGQRLKKENPPAYQNCMLHWQAHQMMIPPPMPEEGQGPEQKSKSGENPNAQ
jgi:hypothetical protein